MQTRPEKKNLAHYGLDLIEGTIRNNVAAGVLEPVLAKTKIVQVRACIPLAHDVACVLREAAYIFFLKEPHIIKPKCSLRRRRPSQY